MRQLIGGWILFLGVALPAATARPAAAPRAEAHPNMYLDAAEIAAIKAKVQSGSAPWKAAYDRMIGDANGALSVSAMSVTYQGKSPSSGNNHDYWTEPPYSGTGDGVINPDNDRADYNTAIKWARAVRDLGQAYAFTGQAKYADKAVALIHTWCLDPGTRMNPKFTNGQSYIELCITMPGAFYGGDLIWNYPGWKAADRQAFQGWVDAFASSGQSWSRSNNFENWRMVFLSSAAVIAEDPGLRTYAFDRWKSLISSQMATNGRMTKETGRTKSLSYSMYAVNAMAQTAEIARHFGVDLYGFKLSDGRGLERTLDYHAPYVVNPSSWPYEQISAFKGENCSIYEMGYLYKQKSAYLSVINKWKRPMYENRIMGYTTLTHAYGAYPFSGGGAPPPPPSNSPPSVNLTEPSDAATFAAPATILMQATASDSDGSVARVEFRVDGSVVHTDTTSPYSYQWDNVTAGTYSVTARAVDDDGAATSSASATVTVTDSGAPPSGTVPVVTSFTLVDADLDVPLAGFDPLTDGATINLAALPTRNLNILINTSPSPTGSVRIEYDGDPNYHTESILPYCFAGDTSGDYNPWTPQTGPHSLRATPYTESGGGGTAGTPLLVTFTVVDDPSGAGTGGGGSGGTGSGTSGASSTAGGGSKGDACGATGFEFALALLGIFLRRRKAHR